MHLTDVAAAGNTGSPPFAPASKDALVDVFAKIIGGAMLERSIARVEHGEQLADPAALRRRRPGVPRGGSRGCRGR